MDYSLPNAPPKTNVSVVTYHTIYTFSRVQLWLAYALAVGSATVTVLIGYLALIRNGAAFSDDFSTILRTTRNAALTVGLHDTDATGHAPLPNHLARAKVRVGNQDDNVSRTPVEKAMSISASSNTGKVSTAPSFLGPLPFEVERDSREGLVAIQEDMFHNPILQGFAGEDAELDITSQTSSRSIDSISTPIEHWSDVSRQDDMADQRTSLIERTSVD